MKKIILYSIPMIHMIASAYIEIMNKHPKKEEKHIQKDEGDTIVMNLGIGENKKEVSIGANPIDEKNIDFTQILREYVGIFSCSYADIPGLNIDMVMHEIHTNPEFWPVKQKLRKLILKWSLKMKDEVIKQLSMGFIRVINYPSWLANIVAVPKLNVKVRMCVDYKDLNRVCPNDDFPLPNIDFIILINIISEPAILITKNYVDLSLNLLLFVRRNTTGDIRNLRRHIRPGLIFVIRTL